MTINDATIAADAERAVLEDHVWRGHVTLNDLDLTEADKVLVRATIAAKAAGDVLYRCRCDSPHFHFEAFGRTEMDAKVAFARLLSHHFDNTPGCDPSWVAQTITETEVEGFVLGAGYRDGQMTTITALSRMLRTHDRHVIRHLIDAGARLAARLNNKFADDTRDWSGAAAAARKHFHIDTENQDAG